MNEIERRTLIGAAGIGALAALSKAGPLNPPAGPVAPTGRTTDEIYDKIPAGGSGDGRNAIAGNTGFGVGITAPGSYVLTGDVQSPIANGIVITASDVTLDLNGFAVNSATPGGSGIALAPGIRGVVIRNGRVNGFHNGILVNANCQNVVLEDLLVRSARSTGIIINGAYAVRIRRCTVQDTGSSTVAADAFTDITGIMLNSGSSTAEECVVQRIYYFGAGAATRRGIWVTGGPGNLVTRCTVTNDSPTTGTGVALAGTNVYRDNTVINMSTAYSGGINGNGNV